MGLVAERSVNTPPTFVEVIAGESRPEAQRLPISSKLRIKKVHTMVDRVFDRSNALYVKTVPGKGRGLFANINFKIGDLIERAPTWEFDDRQANVIDLTGILQYYFVRGDKNLSPLARYVVFGLASLVNHSVNPNSETVWTDQESGAWASLVAIRDIKPDEEITQTYTNIPDYPKTIKFVE
ncbi:SET domain-containing protein-lysine N-methyltransferase [Mesorhizobium sp.]|uniref:SET domain-containing protein-lysine N-methyltransferase n=1 Tax=Mesorhizobium sp. TaxID=1871066 RepID=UPI000FE4DCAB|nr:SET domain-containing protein-lysine N-methyltransferase [Mesorhizobium sp.]RWP68822.1 MAG: SET domain-containing protein [Mesorhizobium sp.]